MAANETVPPIHTTQVATTNLEAGPTPPPSNTPDTLYPPEGPNPSGTNPEASQKMAQETPADPDQGAGVEGEEVVWEGRYAMKNFLGRLTFRILLTIAWIGLAVYTWGYNGENIAPLTIIVGVVLLLLWLGIIYRITLARYGHYYRLTTRRLFVSTGLMRRRRDQMELLRIKDVFTRQTLIERWLGLGTVVIVSDDKELPTFFLAGVDDPKRVMDLVWHCARAERDHKSVRLDQI